MRFALAAMAGFDQAMRSKTTIQTRDEVERIVMLATASELMGFSMAPAGLISRLLPYFVPKAYQWKRINQTQNRVAPTAWSFLERASFTSVRLPVAMSAWAANRSWWYALTVGTPLTQPRDTSAWR